jgi:peptide/nickel transport system substrate-binding protein
MLKTYRWQILAFVVSITIFVLALLTRLSTTPPTLEATPVVMSTSTDVPVSEATTIPEVVLSTPLPANINLQSVPSVDDGVATYREAMVGTVQRLNPLYADLNPVDRDITSLIFEGLIRINEYGEPVGNLASSWVISSDALEYVFTLRQDVLWQDGVPFSADDVVYTMSILHDPAFDGLPELGAFWRTIETEKLSQNIVRFRLTQPLSSFLTSLTVGILPVHALSGTTADRLASHPFNLSPIGTGAYQLEALRSNNGSQISGVDLRVAPNFRVRPEGQTGYAIERISFVLFNSFEDAVTALNNGAVDGYASHNRTEREPLLNVTDASAYTAIAPAVGMLIYNWGEGDNVRFFQELRARNALMTGMNRVGPVEFRLTNQAIVATSPLLPNSWAYDANLTYPETNPATAIDLLQNSNIRTDTISPESTAEPDATVTFYSFTILTTEDPAVVNLAQEIANQWSQLRLDVTVESVPADVFETRLENAEFQAAIVELPLGADPDVFAYWHVGQSPDGKNYGGMADDRISGFLERARRDPYGINRVTLYRQFQETFIERSVAIPLYYPLYTYTVNRRVQGIQLGVISSATDRFRNLQEWTLN